MSQIFGEHRVVNPFFQKSSWNCDLFVFFAVYIAAPADKTLNGLTSEFSGKTALEFIHERILIEAKRMLRYTTKPIKEIAYTLHFTDAAHFTNFFKQKTGTTPLEYKQEL